MKNLLSAALLAATLIYISCTPKVAPQIAATPNPPVEPAQWDSLGKPVIGEEEPVEYNFLDEVNITPESGPGYNIDSLKPYNASHTFEHDLLHTKIEISFDWAKKRANGKTTLTLKPWFYATDKLTLDAKNFDILSVTFEGKTEPLKYTYNNEQLVIQLGRTYQRTEEFKITVTYTAKPDERESYGGSAAITQDKGLYFINPDGADKEKPMQIWTQGETESNSFWFPTIDKPNERCTQEMYITVADKYKTLSNGLMMSSKKNADGTRTDYWKMDKPHAPYLFMMAIGEFAVVKDRWRGIDVDYYVEPKYEKDARDIYPYTTEMLEFFSTKLGYNYAWSKFSQVIVRDYVSGAMENTTAVIFGEFMQKTKRELLDDHMTNEKVVAHEMFHHWFGDLVTTESWSNLTLNEGFANYSEYLWLEHKHGRDAADEHEMGEQQGYIFSAGDGGHPLIHYGFNSREDMFDAHSYNKGGAVLHMLRDMVGDEAFFATLQRYLKRNEFTDVEADELRIAFEDITGQDLKWFWNQWYYGAGHPILNIDYGWDELTNESVVTVAQSQEGNEVTRVFNLPLTVDIYDATGKASRENIRMTQRNQTFRFKCAAKPALVNFDANKSLLCLKTDNHTHQEFAFMYQYAPLYRDRTEAMEGLENAADDLKKPVFSAALNDKFHGIRGQALLRADLTNPTTLSAVVKIAETETEPSVRTKAIGLLGQTKDKQYVATIKKSLGDEQAYSVVLSAIAALNEIDPVIATEAIQPFMDNENENFIPVVSEMMAKEPKIANLSYFEKKIDKVDNAFSFPFFENYTKLILGLNDEAISDATLAKFQAIASDPTKNSEWRRFASTKSIADVRNDYREKGNTAKVEALQKMIDTIKEKETDATLKLYYDMF